MTTGVQHLAAGANLDAFWRFYGEHHALLRTALQRTSAPLADAPELVAMLVADPQADGPVWCAITGGAWDELEQALAEVGRSLAQRGADRWFEIVAAFGDVTRDAMIARSCDDAEALGLAIRGLHCLLDTVVACVGRGYLEHRERAVAEVEQGFRVMFDHSPMPMWTFDRATLRFVSVNEAAIRKYGYSRDELATMTLADIRDPEDVAAMREDVERCEGPSIPTVWRHRTKDGTELRVEVIANDFIHGGQNLRLVLLNDITERERAADTLRKTMDQLQHAQKMEAIGRLAGGVAHDFNNLLTVIHSYADMLSETFDATDPRREDTAEIVRASDRAETITRQLLQMSRHGISKPQAVNLVECVENALPMLRRLIGPGVQVVVHQLANPPAITADPGKLEQVLMNLAANARDAMPEGGRLTIEVSATDLDPELAAEYRLPPGSYVVLAVTDTGSGMDSETQQRIFDPFFTTKEAGKGTGLGLSIVHGIVTQAGGAVRVFSEPGCGSTFRVLLPVSAAMIDAPEPQAIEPPRKLPAITVLVVDAHDEVRAVASRVLQEAGCTVLAAASAAAALRLAVSHEGPIEIALVEVVLGQDRGETLIGQLRALRPAISVVLMSGYPPGAIADGATAFQLIPKPFSPKALRMAIARELAPPAGESATINPAREEAKPRVLLADDDTMFRHATARVLRRAGFDVVEVEDGNAAIARIGGEQFDVVVSDVHMPGATGLDLMREIRRIDLDVPILLMSGAPDLGSATAAIEYGAFRYLTKPVENTELQKLVRRAARAHALARIRREATAVVGVPAGAGDRAGLEVRFDQALDQLTLALQPIFDAKTQQVYGFEALVRSREPTMSSPLQLLDAATQLSRLPLLGRKVRALAARALPDLPAGVVLFVNLHPDDLEDSDLVSDDAPLTKVASRVILEVTERATLASSPELANRIARLRALGFRIAVDDIGAGYSGLTSFTELLPEIVKIDMSLVRGIHESGVKQRTVAALCRLCQESDCLVVGEGVETLAERDCLVDLGCDLLQGYLLGRPVLR